MADLTASERLARLRTLDEAVEAIDQARRLVADAHVRLHRVDDLEWLVGKLAVNAPAGTLIPPRLASIVKDCASAYVDGGSSRYTVATPVEDLRP